MTIGVAQDYIVFEPEGFVDSTLALNLLTPQIITRILSNIPGFATLEFKVEDVPSVMFVSGADEPIELPPTPQDVFSVSFPDEQKAQQFRDAIQASVDRGEEKFQSIGVNPTMTVANFGRPDGADASLFGTSRRCAPAHRR